MPHRVVATYQGQPVGRFHGPFASHVAVIVLPNGRVHCRGWGLRVDAEAAVERAVAVDDDLLYAAVHETRPDEDSRRELVRMVRVPKRRAPRAGARMGFCGGDRLAILPLVPRDS